MASIRIQTNDYVIVVEDFEDRVFAALRKRDRVHAYTFPTHFANLAVANIMEEANENESLRNNGEANSGLTLEEAKSLTNYIAEKYL